jgi:hypothetical protein
MHSIVYSVQWSHNSLRIICYEPPLCTHMHVYQPTGHCVLNPDVFCIEDAMEGVPGGL